MPTVNPNVQIAEVLSLEYNIEATALANGVNRDSTVFLSIQEHRRVAAIGIVGNLADTSILTVTLLQATSAAGAGKKVLGTAQTVTADGAGDYICYAEADESDLDSENDFLYVGVRLSHDDAGGNRVTGALLGRVPNNRP